MKKMADAVIVAWQRMADSQLAFGEEQLYGIEFIRIYRMKDGSLKTNPGCGNPDVAEPVGQVDPAVSVLSVRQQGRPVGAVVNFACHPAVVGGAVQRRLHRRPVRQDEGAVWSRLCHPLHQRRLRQHQSL